MEENEHIVNIRKAVLALDQINLYTDANVPQLTESCVEYLRNNGYKVVKLPKCVCPVKSLNDLISLFYNIMELKHPGDIMYYKNGSEDNNIAKMFVASRVKVSGISKKEAFNECAEIIRTIFNHEEEFNFKHRITFKVLGQNKSVWITDKAIQIMNRGLDINREEKAEKMREKMINAQDKNDLGFGDLQEILDKLENDNGR